METGGLSKPKPVLAPKPRLTPKPFSLQKNTSIRSIHAPKTTPVTSNTTTQQPIRSDSTSVPKPTLPKPAQPPTTSDSKPTSVSALTKDQPEATKESKASPHGEDTLISCVGKLDPAPQTAPPKETPNSKPIQKDDVIQTDRKASKDVLTNSEQKDGGKDKEEPETPDVQKHEDSGADASSSASPAYRRGSTRKRLSMELTSKFESGGLSLPPQPRIAMSTTRTKDDEAKPESPDPERRQPASESSNRESNEGEQNEDYVGGGSIKRRISRLFDSSSRPEVTTKREEPEIVNGVGGVKERIKNWTTEISSEGAKAERKPQVAPRTHPKRFEPVSAPAAEETPKMPPVEPSVTETSPSLAEDLLPEVSPTERHIETKMETSVDDLTNNKLPESPAETSGEHIQSKSTESDVMHHRSPSTGHAATDEGDLAESESAQHAPKRDNVKRRSVRFGVVERDDGGPPLILGSGSDSSTEEEEEEEEEGGEEDAEEDIPVSVPVYRRVLQKKDDEAQQQEEERLKHLEFEKRRAEEIELARLKLEEERKRKEEEREKEIARQREEEERERKRLEEEEMERQRKEELERERLKEERERARKRLEEEEMERQRKEAWERERLEEEEKEKERLREEELERERQMEAMWQRQREEERERAKQREERERERLKEEERKEERLREERERQRLRSEERSSLDHEEHRLEGKLREEEMNKEKEREEEWEKEWVKKTGRLSGDEEERERERELELRWQRQKEEDMEKARQKEERLRQEELERERLREEAEERERHRRLRELQERQEERERLRLLEMEKQREEARREEEMRRQVEKERVEQLERQMREELERKRAQELEEKLRREQERERNVPPHMSDPPYFPFAKAHEPTESQIEVAYDDFSVRPPLINVDYDDFSVKPKRWGSQAKAKAAPVRQSWVADTMDKEVEVPVSQDVNHWENKMPEELEKRESLEPTLSQPHPEEEEDKFISMEVDEEAEVKEEMEREEEEEAQVDEAEDDNDDNENENEEQVNSYCINSEDKDTDALIDTEPDQTEAREQTSDIDSATQVPDQVPEVASEEADSADLQLVEEQASFPESSTPLLDTSAQRSKADLGKRRIRTRPSRIIRTGSTPRESLDWRTRDSTDEKEASSKPRESDSDEEQPKPKVVCSPPPTSQKVPVFPGLSPASLIAQLKKRAVGGGTGGGEETEKDKGRGEKESPSEEATPSPSQLSRSPRTAAHLAGAARVLPPIGGMDGGAVSSPAWLKELKSKKRLSQYDTES